MATKAFEQSNHIPKTKKTRRKPKENQIKNQIRDYKKKCWISLSATDIADTTESYVFWYSCW